MKSVIVNNKRVYAFTSKKELLDFIIDKNKILIAINAEKIILKSDEITEIINANIGYSDGIGSVLALKRKGVKTIKIAGAELWLDIIRRFEGNKSVYLLGSTKTVIEKTVSLLQRDYPKLNIVGYRDGYFKEDEKANILKDIKTLSPQIVFVALGSPRQEFLMADFIKEHSALYMGLGGSFDVYSGEKKRAPIFYQRLGLEWFYRFLKEPSRISRHKRIVHFFVKLALNKL